MASVDTFEECAPARNDTVGRMAQRALLMRGDSAMQVADAGPRLLSWTVVFTYPANDMLLLGFEAVLQ